MKKDFVSLAPYTREELEEILARASWMKRQRSKVPGVMTGKTAALVFEKQSLRTHVSFEVGIAQLGGQAIYLSQQQIGLATREAIRDVAGVLSRYNDMIIARTLRHATVVELALHATVPVINALTDLLHPCQIMADALTLQEHGRLSPEAKVVFVGDGNNVVNSWLELAEKIPLHFVLACPPGYEPDTEILECARASGAGRIEILHDPVAAAEGAAVLYTDVWVSMGQEAERARREEDFRRFTVNSELLRAARRDCIVMHCLPAHRGEEITADVLEGSQSVVLQQAENRLHVQKAVMAHLMETAGVPEPGEPLYA